MRLGFGQCSRPCDTTVVTQAARMAERWLEPVGTPGLPTSSGNNDCDCGCYRSGQCICSQWGRCQYFLLAHFLRVIRNGGVPSVDDKVRACGVKEDFLIPNSAGDNPFSGERKKLDAI
jgi:hypothetical protein